MIKNEDSNSDGGVVYFKLDLTDSEEKRIYESLSKMKPYKRNSFIVNAIIKSFNKDHEITVSKLLNTIENLSEAIKLPNKIGNKSNVNSVDNTGIKPMPVLLKNENINIDIKTENSLEEDKENEDDKLEKSLLNMFKAATA